MIIPEAVLQSRAIGLNMDSRAHPRWEEPQKCPSISAPAAHSLRTCSALTKRTQHLLQRHSGELERRKIQQKIDAPGFSTQIQASPAEPLWRAILLENTMENRCAQIFCIESSTYCRATLDSQGTVKYNGKPAHQDFQCRLKYRLQGHYGELEYSKIQYK